MAQIAYGICTKSFVGCGFAPDPLGEPTSLPKAPSWFRGGAHVEREGGGEGRGKGGREGKGGEGVPECQNPELASLSAVHKKTHTHGLP